MRFFSQDEIERISQRVYKAYKRGTGFSGTSGRVNPDWLAVIYGLIIDCRHLSEDRSTLGLTSFELGDCVDVFDDPYEKSYISILVCANQCYLGAV